MLIGGAANLTAPSDTVADASSGRAEKFALVTVNVGADPGSKPAIRISMGTLENVLLIDTIVRRRGS